MSAISTTTDFLRLLRDDPEFRAQVRQELQIQELMDLPGKFAAFVSQTQQEFSEIKSRIGRLEENVGKLQADVARLQVDVAKLQADVAKLQADVAKLQADVASLDARVGSLDARVGRLEGEVGRLNGAEYERRVSRTCMGVISNAIGGLRRVVLVHSSAYATNPEFSELLEISIDDDKITPAQLHEVMYADAILRAHKGGETIYAVVEISVTVHQDDIDRAAERAAIIQQATGAPVYPVVIGDSIPPRQQAQANAKNVIALTVQRGHY